MVRVKIYKPVIKRTVKDKGVIRTIEKKQGQFIEERAVMERTLALFENGGDQTIIDQELYMRPLTDKELEEHKKKVAPKKKSSIKTEGA